MISVVDLRRNVEASVIFFVVVTIINVLLTHQGFWESVKDGLIFAVIAMVVYVVWDLASTAFRARRRGDAHGSTDSR
ncbi:hypothetical protein [Gordonia polyisoprenivorans]|uniref:hypothetical protein n=1 Tax=Gordonia polyisoprenivorans TaxID=84595 RepID=UPI001AD6BEBA|nr:hypothetical protein [Gordonia polyisoprenivorans]QTI70201.1 hypothetical protein J6U32_06415 [Gordonia polyisoprenivorans]